MDNIIGFKSPLKLTANPLIGSEFSEEIFTYKRKTKVLSASYQQLIDKEAEKDKQKMLLDELRKRKDFKTNPLCLLDGLTVLNLDKKSHDYIWSNDNIFDIKESYSYKRRCAEKFCGKMRNIDLRPGSNKRGTGTFMNGSFHKWKNFTHNYDYFHLSDLHKLITDWKDIFQVDVKLLAICSAEAGLNFFIPKEWNMTSSEIVINVGFFKGIPKKKWKLELHKNGGWELEFTIGNFKYKIYDKGRQQELDAEVLRIEIVFCNLKALKTVGIETAADLENPLVHKKIAELFLKTLNTLILIDKDLKNHPSLTKKEKDFASRFSSREDWARLGTMEKVEKDQYNEVWNKRNVDFIRTEAEYDSLINKKGGLNIKDELVKKARRMLCL